MTFIVARTKHPTPSRSWASLGRADSASGLLALRPSPPLCTGLCHLGASGSKIFLPCKVRSQSGSKNGDFSKSLTHVPTRHWLP